MKMIIRSAILAVMVSFFTAAVCFSAGPMNNNDVIKLVKAGIAENLIISTIDSSEAKFDISADALIKMKEARVPDTIIQRMILKKTGLSQPQSPAKGKSCHLATSEELQAIMDGNRQVNLTYRLADIDEDISAGSSIANALTLGIAPEQGTVAARISGSRATNRIRSKTPVFPDLVTTEGQSPEDTFALVKLAAIDNDRILIIGEASSSLFGGYKSRSKFRDGTQIPLKLDKIQSSCIYKDLVMNVYRGVPTSPLAPGEYALLYGENFYDFGVDP